MLTVGSLFSGIGGLDYGFELAGGYRILWQVEKDAYCRKVLKKHWPAVPCYDDIHDVSERNLEPVDVLVGGFPCQDVSSAGKGAGVDGGARSGLWREFARLIGCLGPSYIVVENVQGLTFKGRGMGRVLSDLASLGYDAEWEMLPAAAFGAPHIRDRIFIVAYPQGWGEPADLKAVDAFQALGSGVSRASGGAAGGDPTPGVQFSGRVNSAGQALLEYPYGAEWREISPAGLDVTYRSRRERREAQRRSAARGPYGGAGPVADALSDGRERFLGCQYPLASQAEGAAGRSTHAGDVPDTGSQRLDERHGVFRREPGPHTAAEAYSWWDVEPEVDRVVNGFPGRVDQVRGLGNAVVPYVAKFVAEELRMFDEEITA